MSPRRNWDSPNPSPQASVPSPPPPGPKGGGPHSPAAKGVGESQFRRLEKKLSTLPLLCGIEASQTSVFVWFSTRIFPLCEMLFKNRLEFSCLGDF